MANPTRKAVLTALLPTGSATQEFLAELTLDLGLFVTLLHGRISEQETLLKIEIAGSPAQVKEGVFRCRRSTRRSPHVARAS